MSRRAARAVVPAAAVYFGVVFAIAFGLGTLRILVVAPRLGALGAVLLEAPLILAVSWWAAGWSVNRFGVSERAGERLAMGALAFGLLMVAELALAVLAFGISATDYAASMVTPAGTVGLAAQLGFAAIPYLRRRRGR